MPTQMLSFTFESARMIAQEPLKVVAFRELDAAKFSRAHVRAMLVAGSGFLVDSYDNFVISLMAPMLAWEYYGQPSLPDATIEGWIKGASSWGNMVGHVAFAILGDVLGRKKVYGIELIILIVGALLCAVAVWPVNGDANNALILLGVWRFVLGIGVGGDYPVSAVLTAEFASSDRRGQYIAAVFAMQGFGILLGAAMAIAVLAMFQNAIVNDGRVYLGYCWRILAGFGAVPAFAAVYWRLRIPETPRFTANVLGDEVQGRLNAAKFLNLQTTFEPKIEITSPVQIVFSPQFAPMEEVVAKPKFTGASTFGNAFRSHFSKWTNLKVLLGCAACWFFLDVGYYGTNLNTPFVLDILGYGSKSNDMSSKTAFDDLWAKACGNAIIAMFGNVPGYWFTVFLIESWGRKPIQYLGFSMLTFIFLVLALWLDALKASIPTLFVVFYALAQFFFNFGPNATTFILPAEVFPTAVRSTGHGISAAAGKAGAIVAAQGVQLLASNPNFGLRGVLFIFSGSCLLGLYFSTWVPETKGMTLEELGGEHVKEDVEGYHNFLSPPGARDSYAGGLI